MKAYLSGVWGQYVKFEITLSITGQIKIDAIGFEYLVDSGVLQDAS